MRTTKYLFFAYLLLIVLAVAGYGVSRSVTPARDPDTMFTIYISSIRSLDPVMIADVTSSDIMGHVYETLYNYKFGGRPDELFPQLAADFPTIAADRVTYTIPIRRGVLFYDPGQRLWPNSSPATSSGGAGTRELTAHDVVYSWKRLANFHSAAPSYSTVLQDNIVGLDDFRTYTESVSPDRVDYSRVVEGLVAVDNYTLRLKLTKPIPNFPQLAAYLGTAVIPHEAVAEYGSLKEHPVATGPYALEAYKVDQRLTLRANPAYRGRPDIDGGAALPDAERMPNIKRIQYDYALELLPSWHLFLQGRYDVMSIPKETFGQAVRDRQIDPKLAEKSIELRIRQDLGLYFIQFNMTDPVIGKNKALRQAMSLAFDREKYIRVYRNGRGLPGTGILPPDAPCWDPNYVSKYARFDLEAAKAKLQEAQQAYGGELPTLKLQMGDTDTEMRQYAEYFVSQWKQIGLKVTPEYNTYARFLEKLDAKDYQITFTGWVPDYPDEKTYLRLFDATLAKPPGSNSSGFDQPEYQTLLEQSLVMERSPERDALYVKMRDIIDEELPVFAIYYPQVFGLRYSWVGGYQNPFFNQGFYAYQTLDTQRRLQAQRK